MYVSRSTTNTYARTPHVNDALCGCDCGDGSLMKCRILNENESRQGFRFASRGHLSALQIGIPAGRFTALDLVTERR